MRRALGFLLASVLAAAANAQTLTGRVVSIADGDTLTVLVGTTQHKIRLAEIDAPEKAQAFGQTSRNSLANLCFGKSATFESNAKDQYGRTVSRVVCDGEDANKKQVALGYAWVYTQYSKDTSFLPLQKQAREMRLGLWADASPTPPWLFRRAK